MDAMQTIANMENVASLINQAVTLRDKRNSLRVSVSIVVDVQDSGSIQATFSATNISRTGAFLKKIHPSIPLPAVNSVLKLQLRWPVDTPIPPVEINAEVMRVELDGVGVKFLY